MADNQKDMVEAGRSSTNMKHWNVKLTDEQVDEVRTRHQAGETQRALAKEFEVTFQHISRLVNQQRRTHGEKT
jgi:transcriptional regulator